MPHGLMAMIEKWIVYFNCKEIMPTWRPSSWAGLKAEAPPLIAAMLWSLIPTSPTLASLRAKFLVISSTIACNIGVDSSKVDECRGGGIRGLCGGVVFGSDGNAAVQDTILHIELGCWWRLPPRCSENEYNYNIWNQDRVVADIGVTSISSKTYLQ